MNHNPDRIEIERDITEKQKTAGQIYPTTEIKVGDIVIVISGVVKDIKAYKIKK